MPPKPRSPQPEAHTSNRGSHNATPLGECGYPTRRQDELSYGVPSCL